MCVGGSREGVFKGYVEVARCVCRWTPAHNTQGPGLNVDESVHSVVARTCCFTPSDSPTHAPLSLYSPAAPHTDAAWP
jgi:hypothetical protein